MTDAGPLYLDTETTGLGYLPGTDFVEVSIIDDAGNVLLDTLANPGFKIPQEVIEIHGITNEMVANAPTSDAVRAEALRIMRGRHVIIYNADYDTRFFPGLDQAAARVDCCMLTYAQIIGDWNEWHGGWRWHKLVSAARHVGHRWDGPAHRALSDCFASRSVWAWCNTSGQTILRDRAEAETARAVQRFVDQHDHEKRAQADRWRHNQPQWIKDLTAKTQHGQNSKACCCAMCRRQDVYQVFIEPVLELRRARYRAWREAEYGKLISRLMAGEYVEFGQRYPISLLTAAQYRRATGRTVEEDRVPAVACGIANAMNNMRVPLYWDPRPPDISIKDKVLDRTSESELFCLSKS